MQEVMLGSEALQSLTQRLRQSQERLRVVHAVLPSQLRDHVTTGGLDTDTWVLLADSAATAAKLRQWVPLLDDALREAGLKPIPIRIRVQPR